MGFMHLTNVLLCAAEAADAKTCFRICVWKFIQQRDILIVVSMRVSLSCSLSLRLSVCTLLMLISNSF